MVEPAGSRGGPRRRRRVDAAERGVITNHRRGGRRAAAAGDLPCLASSRPRDRRLWPGPTATPLPSIGPCVVRRLVSGAQRGQEPREPAPGGQGGELRHSQAGTLSTHLRLGGGRVTGWLLVIAHHHTAVEQRARG
eukprot:scaffold7487_cov37-Phaeocystis_antarctica.AAC.1